MAMAAALPIVAQVAGKMILDKVMGGGGGKGGGPSAIPPSPHIQTPVDYAVGQRSAYVAGRGFRRLQ